MPRVYRSPRRRPRSKPTFAPRSTWVSPGSPGCLCVKVNSCPCLRAHGPQLFLVPLHCPGILLEKGVESHNQGPQKTHLWAEGGNVRRGEGHRKPPEPDLCPQSQLALSERTLYSLTCWSSLGFQARCTPCSLPVSYPSYLAGTGLRQGKKPEEHLITVCRRGSETAKSAVPGRQVVGHLRNP